MLHMRYIQAMTGLVFVFVVATAMAGEDALLDNAVQGLHARRDALDVANVEFSRVNYEIPVEVYDSLFHTSERDTSDVRPIPDLTKLDGELAAKGIRPLTAVNVKLWKKDAKWRVLTTLDPARDTQRERLQRSATTRTTRIAFTEAEDTAFNGEYIESLHNGTHLFLVQSGVGDLYPTLQTLDFTMGPWEMALLKGAAVGQRIVVDKANEGSLIKITYEDIDRSQPWGFLTYIVNVRKSYSPQLVFGKARNGARSLELRYECIGGLSDPSLPTVHRHTACSFKEKTVSLEVYDIRSWSTNVADGDLSIRLPGQYTLVDNRFGGAPMMKHVPGPTTVAATQPSR